MVAFSWLCTFECGRWLSKWEMVICNCKDGRPLCPVTPPLLIPTRRPIGASRIFQMINPVEKFYWAGNQEVADSLHCQTIGKRNFSSDPPRTPAILFRISWFNQTVPPVLDLESFSMCCYLALAKRLFDQWGILKHFPQSRCILIFHWLREKYQSYHNRTTATFLSTNER